MALRLYGDGNIENVTSINTAVSSTELGYLDGVTSGIQSQVDSTSSSVGLSPITPTSVTNGSYTGNIVTFSSVSSCIVNGIFSSNFNNYKMFFRGTASGARTEAAGIRFSNNGTLTTTDYTTIRMWSTGSSGGNQSDTYGTGLFVTNMDSSYATEAYSSIDILNPFQSSWRTGYVASGYGVYNGTRYSEYVTGFQRGGLSFDGIQIGPLSGGGGSLSGTLEIYGYG